MDHIENYRTLLITGGTGSFGRRFVRTLLSQYNHFEQIIVLSRDEYKQYRMRQEFPQDKYPQLRFVLGNVRDQEKLNQIFAHIELVIHAAALKQVDTSETNPMEFIKTNVLGSENVIRAAIANAVKKVIALSSDKAVNPVSLYGGTKLCADKLFLAANIEQSLSKNKTIFSIARYGNVLGTRGSVVPLFLEKASKKEAFPITHNAMTRFSVPPGIESKLLLYAIQKSRGGEIFVPKIPSYKIQDLAKAIDTDLPLELIGIRPGEKLHEELISLGEAARTYDAKDYYIIFPDYMNPSDALKDRLVSPEFFYTSQNNTRFLSITEIQAQIGQYLENESLF